MFHYEMEILIKNMDVFLVDEFRETWEKMSYDDVDASIRLKKSKLRRTINKQLKNIQLIPLVNIHDTIINDENHFGILCKKKILNIKSEK